MIPDSTVVLTIQVKQHAMNWLGSLIIVFMFFCTTWYITYRNTYKKHDS